METLTSAEFANGFMEALKDQLKNPDAHRGIRTGIPEIDKELGGFKLGRYIVIGGAEKSGKSSLLLSLVSQFAASTNRRFLFSGFEMDNYETAERALSNVSAVPIIKIRNLDITENEMRELHKAEIAIGNWNGHWSYGVSTFDDQVDQIEEVDPDIVVVDYIQLMDSHKYSKMPGNKNYHKFHKH